MVPDRIEHGVVVAAPAERVWAALTEAAQLGTWFADSADLDPRPGGELVLRWVQHGSFYARIERIEPPVQFAWRWALHPDVVPDAGNSTLAVFTLTPEGDGTRVTVNETGFASLGGGPEKQAQHVRQNAEGWRGGLAALKGYLEK